MAAAVSYLRGQIPVAVSRDDLLAHVDQLQVGDVVSVLEVLDRLVGLIGLCVCDGWV